MTEKMSTFTATMIAEGAQEADSDEQMVEAWQHLIDTGLAWQLQGFFGRQADALIRAGLCKAADVEECNPAVEGF